MKLSGEIREKLIAGGASLVGFADLSSLPLEARNGFEYGIAIGAALNPEVVRGIGNGPTLRYYEEYNRLNKLLNDLDEYAAEILTRKGFHAHAKTQKTVVVDEETRSTILPHKTVATRAGIGWIGKCALLVTKEFGSALRISSVLTDAELDVGIPMDTSNCGDCSECTGICPAGAVKGENWDVKKKREEIYNAFDCRKLARERCAGIGINESLCGLCMYTCPWTRKYVGGY